MDGGTRSPDWGQELDRGAGSAALIARLVARLPSSADAQLDPTIENAIRDELEERSCFDTTLRGVSRAMARELEDRLRFEALVAELSVRFINLPPEQVDGAIEEAQRLFCETLGLDRSSLFQHFDGEPGALLLTHLFQRGEDPRAQKVVERRADPRLGKEIYWLLTDAKPSPTYVRSDVQVLFPWVYSRLQRHETVLISDLADLPEEAARDGEMFRRYGTESTVVVPLMTGGTNLGCLTFASLQEHRKWSPAEVRRFQCIAHLFSNALARKRADEALHRSYGEIKQLKDRLQAETEYLKTEFRISQEHSEIIGRSDAIRQVLQQLEQVAPADCTVLITGETGTGKELVARAIHRLSARRERAIVIVNCAALPAQLVESELFGRERGAYTGALTSEVGRFEVADGSTIFLDEVGELSPEVQAKLLRVLQEGEFQRLGSPKTRKVNLRVIAASNKDLGKEVREKRFREDLYYRLQVFPIQVPPLRERVEDIPLLVSAFVEEFSSRMGKQVNRIPRKVLDALEQYSWPGNIRELRNLVERGVILSPGDTLVLPDLGDSSENALRPTSLADVEREHILKTLESSRWRIKGRYGAAKVLGVNPSTLYSRMAKLGIRRPAARDGMPT